MTMWPDQPPLSRRQVRQKKREEAGLAASDPDDAVSEPETVTAVPSGRTGRRVRWDPSADGATPLSRSSVVETPAADDSGRGASAEQPAATESTAPELGDDQSEAADSGAADSISADSGAVDSIPADTGAADTGAADTGDPEPEDSPFRMRNYDADGVSGGLGSEPGIESSLAGLARKNPEPVSDAEAAAGSSDAFPMTTEIYVNDRTITRRELRAMRAQAEAAGEPVPLIVFQRPGSNAPAGSGADSAELAEPDSELTAEPRADEAGVVEEVPLEDVPVDAAPVDENPVDQNPVDEAPVEGVPVEEVPVEENPVADEESPVAPEADEAGVVEETPVDTTDAADDHGASGLPVEEAPDGELNAIPVDESDLSGEHHDFVEAELVEPEELIEPPDPAAAREMAAERDALADERVDDPTADDVSADGRTGGDLHGADLHAADPADADVTGAGTSEADATDHGSDDAPRTGPTTVGHWSTAPDETDVNELNGSTLSRDIGLTTGVIGTHALVLPSVPDASEQLMTPISNTGEIIVTGIVELPRSFGETGAHPALFDHSDVDALIDDSDREDAASGSEPVRASRAVASNISSGGVIEAPTPRRARWPLVLGIIGVAAVFIGIAAALAYAFSTGII